MKDDLGKIYHITKEKYLPSILVQGLLINSRKTGFCNRSSHSMYKKYYNMQPIFLTNDIELTVNSMLTADWISKNKPILLEVDVKLNEKNSSMGWYTISEKNEIKASEFRYYNNIPAKDIKVIKLIEIK